MSSLKLRDKLPEFLARQRWFAGGGQPPRTIRVAVEEQLESGTPALWRVVVEADGVPYQVLVGLRPEEDDIEFLHGRDDAVLGVLELKGERVIAYDALLDGELAMRLLSLVSDGAEKAEWVRPMTVEQSNTSLVFEDRLILKVFRRLHEGPHPEAEVTQKLDEVGFNHLAEPLAAWHANGTDLALLQPYLAGGTEGWALALASLRDFYASPGDGDPAGAGGDFASESERLGQVTARMHLALAAAFGSAPGRPAEWVDVMREQARQVAPDEIDRVEAVFDRLTGLDDAGVSIRVHGDYHLGQVMRTDVGWYVLDFEGEPARPLADRRKPTSPLKDVAGMLRSFHYAAEVAMREREEERQQLGPLAAAWENRNRQAFLVGYRSTRDIETLLPNDESVFLAVLAAFELDKSVYEVAYERAHRPDWVTIPEDAIRRILNGYYPQL